MAQVKYGCHAVVKFKGTQRESLKIIKKADEFCQRRGIGFTPTQSVLYPGVTNLKLQSSTDDSILINFHVVYSTMRSVIGYIKRFKNVEILDQK
jgi:hypothetical protein